VIVYSRVLIGSTVAIMSFATFAGCTADKPPVHHQAACTSKTATIVWDQGSRAEDALIGVYRETFSPKTKTLDFRFTPIDVHPQFDVDAITEITGTNTPARSAWEGALLVDARRTGQAGSKFGELPVVDQTRPTVQPSKPTTGTFVDAVSANQFTMPFTIRCADGKKVAGSVTAPLTGGTVSFLYRCGDHRYIGLPALAYCDRG
jgi:hypothetical protein